LVLAFYYHHSHLRVTMPSPFLLSPLADKIAAYFGTQGANTPYQPAPAAVMVIDPTQGPFAYCVAPAGNVTLNTSPGQPGQNLSVICVADAGGTRTFTFGNNFRATGTAAPIALKAICVEFVAGIDGSWIEMGRPTGTGV
jgi:hypothetical protein